MSLLIKPLVLTAHQTHLLQLSRCSNWDSWTVIICTSQRKSTAIRRLKRTRTGPRSSHSHFHLPQHPALRNIGRKSPRRAHLLASLCPQHDELFNIMLLHGWPHTAVPEPTNQGELWPSGTSTRHRWDQQHKELALITQKRKENIC